MVQCWRRSSLFQTPWHPGGTSWDELSEQQKEFLHFADGSATVSHNGTPWKPTFLTSFHWDLYSKDGNQDGTIGQSSSTLLGFGGCTSQYRSHVHHFTDIWAIANELAVWFNQWQPQFLVQVSCLWGKELWTSCLTNTQTYKSRLHMSLAILKPWYKASLETVLWSAKCHRWWPKYFCHFSKYTVLGSWTKIFTFFTTSCCSPHRVPY